MNTSTFHVFELKDISGGTPFARTTDQGIAAFVFSSAANALKYATGKDHGHDWRVRELNVFDARDWLYDAKTSNQVTVVWPDPDPVDEGHREIFVDEFLAILDAECQQ